MADGRRASSSAENRRTLCYAMIETPGALADVEAIARLDTVDGLFVGPADLSMTRGRGPFKATAKDLADFARVAAVAAACRQEPGPCRRRAPRSSPSPAGMAPHWSPSATTSRALRLGFTQGLAVASKG